MAKNRMEWLDEVLSRVRFWPDHPAIRRELADHMEDRYQALKAAGLSTDEAYGRSIDAMGDPAEVGRLLDAAHRPLLGWLWKVSR